jgi:hypothetical protein
LYHLSAVGFDIEVEVVGVDMGCDQAVTLRTAVRVVLGSNILWAACFSMGFFSRARKIPGQLSNSYDRLYPKLSIFVVPSLSYF